MKSSLVELVWQRSRGVCEYCQMSQSLVQSPFQLDHIIARKHGGADAASNLALSCYTCNTHKGPNIAGVDPESGDIVRLYHPRTDVWSQHFQWHGPILLGLTPEGRATIEVLSINLPHLVRVRQSLSEEGLLPPFTAGG